jgi:hypothetical protein
MSISQESNSTIAQQVQRQAIYAGLMSILTETEANDALEKWTACVNETGSVFNGLNNFARDVCVSLKKNDQQRALVKALNRALIIQGKPTLPIKAQDNDLHKTFKFTAPSSLAVSETAVAVADSTTAHVDQAISTPDFETFKVLFMCIINLIDKYNQPASLLLKPFLNELVESMAWSEAQQAQMTTLIATGNTVQVRSYKPDQLKTFISHVRHWMEDEMSIADTVRMIGLALKETEESPVAAHYSPKNFV